MTLRFTFTKELKFVVSKDSNFKDSVLWVREGSRSVALLNKEKLDWENRDKNAGGSTLELLPLL